MNYIFRLNEILKERKRGVRELARATGLTVTTISRICNNRNRGITLDVVGKICSELGIQPGELYKQVE